MKQKSIDYDKLFSEFGATPAGVAMTGEGQKERFAKLSEVFYAQPFASILDIGCGYGAFYEYLWKPCNYCGLDSSSIMIEYAKEEHPQVGWFCRSVLSDEDFPFTDIVVSSSLLSTPGFGGIDAAERAIHRMFSHCKKKTAFNFLSDRGDFTDEGLIYYNIGEILEICMRMTKRIKVDIHYRTCDVAVFMERV